MSEADLLCALLVAADPLPSGAALNQDLWHNVVHYQGHDSNQASHSDGNK